MTVPHDDLAADRGDLGLEHRQAVGEVGPRLDRGEDDGQRNAIGHGRRFAIRIWREDFGGEYFLIRQPLIFTVGRAARERSPIYAARSAALTSTTALGHPMPMRSTLFRIAALPLLIVTLSSTRGFARLNVPVVTTPHVRTDSVAGNWQAKGSDPQWDGRFVLRLPLEQVGDSVNGTYQFNVDAAAVTPPADVFGAIRNTKLRLEDRNDKLWLSLTLRRGRLDGQLAGGSSRRAYAVPISFERVQ